MCVGTPRKSCYLKIIFCFYVNVRYKTLLLKEGVCMGHLEHSCEPRVEVKVAAESQPWRRSYTVSHVCAGVLSDLGPLFAQSLDSKLVSFKWLRAPLVPG